MVFGNKNFHVQLGCNYRLFTKLNLCNEVVTVFFTAGALLASILKAIKQICLQHETKTRDRAALIWQSIAAGKTLFSDACSNNKHELRFVSMQWNVFQDFLRVSMSQSKCQCVCGHNWDVAKSYKCIVMEYGSNCQTITRKRFGDIWSTAIRIGNSVAFWKIGNAHPKLNQY